MIQTVDIQLGCFCPPIADAARRVRWAGALWNLHEGRNWWGPEWQILTEVGGSRVIVGSWIYGQGPSAGDVSVAAGGFTLFASREQAEPAIRSAMDGRSTLPAPA